MRIPAYISSTAVVVFSFALAACSSNDLDEQSEKVQKKASDRLVGKWEMDMEAMFEKMLAAAKSDEDRAKIEEGKGEALAAPRMRIEFTADGKIITTIPGGARTSTDEGTYEVKSEDGDSLVIHSQQSGKSRDIKMKFINDDTLDIENQQLGPEIKSMVFKRVK